MTNDVGGGEPHDGDALDALEPADRIGEPRLDRIGQVDLVGSPQITIRLRIPKRVRNIFICSGVVFCASSRMMKASLSVRPRMKASGAISISPDRSALDLLGRQHVVERVVKRTEIGIDLLLHVAGKEAEALAGLDRGADRTIRSTLPLISCDTAWATAR